MWIVTKCPIGVDAAELVGGFTTEVAAKAAIIGVGTYMIAHVIPNRVYRTGTLLDVEMIIVHDEPSLRVS